MILKQKDLAEKLNVTSAAITKARNNARLVQGFDAASHAKYDSEGNLLGYFWPTEQLSKPENFREEPEFRKNPSLPSAVGEAVDWTKIIGNVVPFLSEFTGKHKLPLLAMTSGIAVGILMHSSCENPDKRANYVLTGCLTGAGIYLGAHLVNHLTSKPEPETEQPNIIKLVS